MTALLIVLIYLAGLSIVLHTYKPLSFLEKLSIPLLLGCFLTSLLMFLMSLVHVPLTLVNIMLGLVITAAGIGGMGYKNLSGFFQSITDQIKSTKIRIDFIWLGIVAFGLLLFYQIALKGMFWPITEMDAVAGYDLLAKGIADEKMLSNSILMNKELVLSCGPRLFYPPFLSFINALSYSLGYETPKLINIVLAGDFLILFYALVRRFSGPLAAALCTLLVLITPEMFAHIAFSLTNYPSAIFSSIAVIYFYLFFKEKDSAHAILSCLFLSGSMMVRSDNVVFIMAIAPLIAFMIYKKNLRLAYGLAFLSMPVLVFLAWNLYTKYAIGIEQNSFFVKEYTWNGDKFEKLWSYVFSLIKNKSLYGLSFYAFFTFLIINIYFLIKKDMWSFLTMILVAWIPYTMIYYFIEDEAYLFAQGGGWLASGYKRGLFSYIPLVWFYVFVSRGPSIIFQFIEEKVFGRKTILVEQTNE